jgi:hypothetical protein
LGRKSSPGTPERLIEPGRTQGLRRSEITVRLDVNYRTGRLEISTYLPDEGFVRYMKNQAWRLDVVDAEKMPLGSFRLQLPGNPNVIKAALASGRFPGVFAPFPFREIYPKESAENRLLYSLLEKWVEDAQVQAGLQQAYQNAFGSAYKEEDWDKLLRRWKKSKSMRDYFPYDTDTYLTGAPSIIRGQSAVDATGMDRRARRGKRDVTSTCRDLPGSRAQDQPGRGAGAC